MSEERGLICAYLLDGRGGGDSLGWDRIGSWLPESGPLWVHLDRTHENSQRWLREDTGLDPLICDALLAEDARPRCFGVGDGLLVILRGVNLHPQADPEDMVSLRMWIDPGRVISLRHQKVNAVQDVEEMLGSGRGPRSAPDLLLQITARMIDRMEPVLDELDDELAGLEDEILTTQSSTSSAGLAELRRQAITLRRYIAPQREVMSRLQVEEPGWLTPVHRARLREAADRLQRYIEDLDESRERAAVSQEQLHARISAQMNRTMYMLSLVAAVVLPLSLITGLLGINVGGIPWAAHPLGFLFICLILVGLAAIQIWVFRKLNWL